VRGETCRLDKSRDLLLQSLPRKLPPVEEGREQEAPEARLGLDGALQGGRPPSKREFGMREDGAVRLCCGRAFERDDRSREELPLGLGRAERAVEWGLGALLDPE